MTKWDVHTTQLKACNEAHLAIKKQFKKTLAIFMFCNKQK